MSVLSTIGFSIVTSLPMVIGSVGDPFEPRVLAERDNGFVVEVVVSCPAKMAGIMHYDKVARVFTDSKAIVHKTAASAYASTCGLDQKFIALR